ncbi:MAG: nicotinate-nucleotide pyrophosphorylase (carboxylating) [Candidatus Electronema aureum]|uniref:Probable nicotinate-nucleotide pyrophosphorylase [carboxylating] n=1 Tax=Candidatus Electronema aureum TaxID=2005002 RepID=A0A521G547_9BACT|nr:MAG: nicotinate-nucleotide pyrophosphorylase (carboxylating) [Candidatus Electronema aureum]
MDTFLIDELLRGFLREDIEHGDITTEAIFSNTETASASLQARESLIAAGIETVAARVFRLLDDRLIFTQIAPDGARIAPGEVLMTVSGPVRNILRGERVALNLVQRLCGIATLTRNYVDAVQSCKAAIADTRKTTPGLRLLEKYAVRVGGGRNHRYSLSDGVLIKDNHIAACGSISEAVRRTRAVVPHTIAIEVETDTLAQVEECLRCGVQIIMLDNMDVENLRQAVAMIGGKALVEASGGVNLHTVRAIAETGVDIISVGALTHSAPACDIGLDWIS